MAGSYIVCSCCMPMSCALNLAETAAPQPWILEEHGAASSIKLDISCVASEKLIDGVLLARTCPNVVAAVTKGRKFDQQ